MKAGKIISIVMLGAITSTALLGCHKADATASGSKATYVSESPLVALAVEDVSSTGLTLLLESKEEQTTVTYGSWYTVQQEKDGKWKEVKIVCEEEIGWTQEACMLSGTEVQQVEVDWEWMYGELEPGNYRIGKEFSKESEVASDFIVYEEFQVEE